MNYDASIFMVNILLPFDSSSNEFRLHHQKTFQLYFCTKIRNVLKENVYVHKTIITVNYVFSDNKSR